jgi:serine/threonine protein kinase
LLPKRLVVLAIAGDERLDTLEAVDLPWRAGDIVDDQFVIRKQLGRGGMSSVWDGYDKVFQRAVALKTTHERDLGAKLLTDEARALAAIRHPGLPIAYSIGRQRGWTYLVLERLYGVTVEQVMLRPERPGARISVVEAVRILVGIADVLSAVHAAGMVHHDVKPANVMLCAGGRVVLLDFGIMIPEVDAATAMASGTPRYLAPEIVLESLRPGQAHLLDIYALGVMGFELLAGRPPFHADSLEKLMHMHICDRPPDLLELRPEAPVALADLIDSCLAKSPVDRPGIDQVLWALRACGRTAAQSRPMR